MRNIPSPMSVARTMKPQRNGPVKAQSSVNPFSKTIATTPQPAQNDYPLSLPEIGATERKQLQATNFDRIYMKKNEDLESLKQQCKTFKTENNQLKKLNEKLMDRIDYLQSFIDKEAAASDFIYNYPPKAMKDSAEEEDLKKGSKQTAAASEQQRLKK